MPANFGVPASALSTQSTGKDEILKAVEEARPCLPRRKRFTEEINDKAAEFARNFGVFYNSEIFIFFLSVPGRKIRVVEVVPLAVYYFGRPRRCIVLLFY